MSVKFIESFDYDRGFFEVWYEFDTSLYYVNELITDLYFYFKSEDQYRYFVEQTEYYEDWNRAYRIIKLETVNSTHTLDN